jgi:hypothetical protein
MIRGLYAASPWRRGLLVRKGSSMREQVCGCKITVQSFELGGQHLWFDVRENTVAMSLGKVAKMPGGTDAAECVKTLYTAWIFSR